VKVKSGKRIGGKRGRGMSSGGSFRILLVNCVGAANILRGGGKQIGGC